MKYELHLEWLRRKRQLNNITWYYWNNRYGEPVKESKKDKQSHPFHANSKFKFNKVVSDNNK